MANWIITDSINLRHPTNYVQGASEEVLMLPIDNKAHTWEVIVRDGDSDADLTGKTCYAYFARNDNAKVLVNGTITDNVCSVTLDSTCYAIPGFLRAVMIMSDTEQTVAICEKTFRVNPALPGQTVDPGEILPSIDDLLAEIGAMRLATADANAAASAAQTATTAANTAAQTANTNASAAQTAANNANQATTAANQATTAANTAAQNANTKADAAQAAANNAYQAATSATEATSAAQTATNDANTAAQNANTAASTITTQIDRLDRMDRNQNGRLTNIESVTEGFLYDEVADSDTAYSKTVPDNTLPFANLDMIGGKTLVWNQLVDYNKIISASSEIFPSLDVNGVWTFPKSKDISIVYFGHRIEPIAGHSYLMRGDYYYDGTGYFSINWNNIEHMRFNPSTEWQHFETIYKVANVSTLLFYQVARIQGIEYGEEVKAKNIQLFDLTQMFGAGNEPTAEQFEAMFPADYYPYSEPTLMNFSADKVVSKGKNLLDTIGIYNSVAWNGSDAFYVDANGYVHVNKTNTDRGVSFSPYIELEPGTYTISLNVISGIMNTGAIYSQYDRSAENGGARVLTSTRKSSTFTVNKKERNRLYIFYAAPSYTGSVVFALQIEKNEEATDYIPYFESTNDLSPLVSKYFPDGMKSVGDVHDEIDLERGVAVKKVGSYVIDNVNVKLNGSWSTEHPNRVYTSKGVHGCPIGRDMSITKILCDIFNPSMDSYSDMPVMTYYGRSGATETITYVLPESVTSLPMANAWFEEHPTTMFYVLPTPVETPIDPADLVGLTVLNVETGGTITFVNDQGVDYHMPLPNAETWKFNLGSDVVRYDTEQSLTDEQKTTARNNIGAADKDEVIQLRTDTINSLNVLDQKISVLESENTGDSEVGSSANLAFSPIVCWGDSLTYGYSDPLDNNNFDGYSKSRFDHRQRICYPSALAEMVGRPVINLGVSGETCQTIMARQGADPMLTPAFTIPADTTPVEIGTFGNLYNGGLRTLSGRNATILGYGNSGINPCYIKGVKGYLTATGQQSDRSGIKYYFQRETAGTAVSVPDGTVIQTYAMRNLRKGVAIIWMGYNGQFSGPQDMVNKINSMIEYGHYSDYLVLTCNEQYADDSYGYYKAAWGNRFLYLRPLLGRIGVQEAGLWSDGTLKDNGIAQELDYDGVHFNSYGCKAIASFVFKRLLENGSLSKIEEPEVEPDDPNVPGGEDPQDPPVSNPVVDHLDLNGTYNNKHYILKSNEEFTLGRDSYYVTDFAPYGTDLASNDFTMCMKFTGTPSDEMALYTANYNKSYGDQRGISAIWDGSTVSFVLGNNTFNLASGGCTINSDGVNTLIMRKQGTTFGVYCNGTWLHGNTSIGSNVSGAAYLANLKLLLGANRSSGNKDNIVQSTGTLVVSNMVLYDSALSNNEITDYQFPA